MAGYAEPSKYSLKVGILEVPDSGRVICTGDGLFKANSKLMDAWCRCLLMTRMSASDFDLRDLAGLFFDMLLWIMMDIFLVDFRGYAKPT